ncbi:MAG: ferritin-like domain-containing protein [Myxococcota bacterium]
MHRHRLSAFRRRWLEAALVAPFAGGCLGGTLPGTKTLDDEACVSVPLNDACPDDATAESLLVGTTTCETPVREVSATGAFLYSENVVYTGYGGWNPYDSGDTGTGTTTFSEPQTRCCYEAAYIVHPNEGCTIGRPLMVDGVAVSAGAACRSDWSDPLLPDVSGLSPAARAALADAWLRAALAEHASIPAFARVMLDLVALGAPAALVSRVNAAITDEVAHARGAFALARAYAGRDLGPAALPVPPSGAPSLVRLAVETFQEGCLGETLAVALAVAQLHGATDPAVRRVLERIVADEAEHAALAWDIVRWAVDVGGEEVRVALAAAVAGLDRDEIGAELAPGPVGARSHGLSDVAITRAALLDAFDAVILPSAVELLAA